MLRKIFAFVVAIGLYTIAFAQDSAKTAPLSVTGSMDVYYKYDFGKTKANNLTSFTNSHNSFELGMANLKVEHKTSKVDMVADLGFGKREQEFAYNDQGIATAIKQLYVSYMPNSWLKLTAGTWATHIGFESVDAYANRNYSMSYLFTNGPFSHTGVKADFTFKKNAFMAGLSNPTDFRYVPAGLVNRKFFIAQYSYLPNDNFKLYLNYVGGQNVDTSKSRQIDAVMTAKLNSKWNIALNPSINSTERYLGVKKFDDFKTWWGTALYVNFDPTAHFGLTLREEYFSDKNQLKVYSGMPWGGSVFASTLSALLKVDNLTFIPEFRLDHASQPIFFKGDGTSTMTAANFLLAAVYQF